VLSAITVAFAIGATIPLLIFALAGPRIAERVQGFRAQQRGVRIVAGLLVIGLLSRSRSTSATSSSAPSSTTPPA